jgi:response regulator RpfG family c-di-GMP phosphodiesterase
MKKILLVDDEIIIRKLARNTIQSQGYLILEAANGKEALDMARREMPDLVLLDIKMPGLNGFQVCQQLKKEPSTQHIIIIMLTGELSEEEREKGIIVGADDFFVKPFSPLALLNKIRILLEKEIEGVLPQECVLPQIAEESMDNELFSFKEDLLELEKGQLLLYASDLGKIYNEEVKKSKELKQAYQRLKEMDRMKDAFISLVSHELRTPLSIIKGYISLINEVMKNRHVGADLLEFMKAIGMSSDKLDSLIQELLDFSKMKSGLIILDKEEVSIPGILQLLSNDFACEAQKREIEITVDVKTEFRTIKIDRTRIKEAFNQLIKNALLFSPHGGHIRLEAYDEGIWVKIKFCDDGKGIAADELENIFSPFYQSMDFLTREVTGIGLGLTIAKHIIEDHGGSIEVESELGKGSIFSVSLPRSFKDAKEIVAEMQARYPQKIEKLSNSLQVAEKQLLLYAQDMSNLYSKERLKTEQLQDTLKELELTYVQTIAALAQAIDVKDAYTGGHTGRVSYYANCIARQHDPLLQNEKEFIYSLLLHDVGKIGIAEEILGKAGKLSNEEWEKIKAHPDMGAKILDPVKFLSPALASVRSHHERWDGKGYPVGMKSEEIPLSARIIAVADAFDAMTTDRPYRKRMAKETARSEIVKNSGIQFDPGVVESFLKAWDDIAAYCDTTNSTLVM